MLSVRTKWGDRSDSNRYREAHDLGCSPLHHGHHEAGTTGLEPAASRLTSERSARLSYAPEGSAGGIRTHGLELMRLARTASPLPRKSGWQESNLRPPAPEAGGVPSPLQPGDEVPPAGLEPAASGLRTRRHPVRPRGQAPAAGLEPALRQRRRLRRLSFEDARALPVRPIEAPAAGFEPALRN
jgi:hypothetical protein